MGPEKVVDRTGVGGDVSSPFPVAKKCPPPQQHTPSHRTIEDCRARGNLFPAGEREDGQHSFSPTPHSGKVGGNKTFPLE